MPRPQSDVRLLWQRKQGQGPVGFDPWRPQPPLGPRGRDGGEVPVRFKARARPAGGSGEGSRALQDTALRLSPGPPPHPPGPRPGVLEGPSEEVPICLSPHSLRCESCRLGETSNPWS